MPRFRPQLLAIFGAVALIAILGLVYVMQRGPVHAPTRPDTLARLSLGAKPLALPELSFTDAAGRRHTLAEFKGRTVLLNLWATWCGPCVQELPSLLKLQQAMGKDFVVMPVDVGREETADAIQFFKDHGVADLPIYRDSDITMIRKLKAYGLPLTLLIDPSGKEIARAAGPADWGAPESVEYLKAITTGP